MLVVGSLRINIDSVPWNVKVFGRELREEADVSLLKKGTPHFLSESLFWLELLVRNPLYPIHIGLKGLRYRNGAILLLELLH